MSSNRTSRSLVAAAIGAGLVLLGGCASGEGNASSSASTASPAPSPSVTVRPPGAAELAAALPQGESLPGYSVNGEPESRTGVGTPDRSVRPAACRALQDARSGSSSTSVAEARVFISASTFAPPIETLTFTSHRPGGAASYLAAVDKELDACPSLSFLGRSGDRIRAEIERVPDRVSAGDASVSFEMHWALDVDGLTMETFSLVTAVRSGEAIMTVTSDSSVGSRLSAAKKRALLPKLDQALLKREADALRAAQDG
ncbi:hypothetical protein [Streptomyces sp. BE133]|uniref:hypothetical protein n=1 Tax=Streptomyces sp. BE133 TaxID=3002523 RepID=UPI002E7A7DAD|nr:hypothetical protein [Streptomyces sp. BE133]MEE1808893.1 hypothetical protein [Streptomyces sp. BE133]